MDTRHSLTTNKLANRDAILRYVEAGGEGVLLNEKQQELFERWVYADEMVRRNIGKKKREEIANLIRSRWGVSRETAFTDIVNAEIVFSSSTPLNKTYFIQRRMEFLEGQIREASISQNFKGVASLEAILQKYVDLYPETVPVRAPKVTIFNVQNNLIVTQTTAEEAFTEAEQIILELENTDTEL